jgi:hypothetical protein
MPSGDGLRQLVNAPITPPKGVSWFVMAPVSAELQGNFNGRFECFPLLIPTTTSCSCRNQVGFFLINLDNGQADNQTGTRVKPVPTTRERSYLSRLFSLFIYASGVTMKTHFTKIFMTGFAAMAMLVSASAVRADVTVGVNNSAGGDFGPWLGFMNVFELPSNGGGFVFGSPWGIPDLVATFNDTGATLTLSPNTINDPNEFWYQGGRPGEDPMDPNDNGGPGAPGNKIMQANLYQQAVDGLYSGQTVTFSGMILSNTFTSAHSTRVFVSDFAPDYSSRVDSFFDITGPGAFSVSLATINDPARHIQFGFQTTGVNVWATDVGPFGSVVIGTVPEPGSIAVLGMGALGLIARRRRV